MDRSPRAIIWSSRSLNLNFFETFIVGSVTISQSTLFPCLHRSGNDSKHGAWIRMTARRKGPQPCRIPLLQLQLKMFPFIPNLSQCYRNPLGLIARVAGTANLPSVEVVATARRFVVDDPKVRRDGMRGIVCLSESKKLRVVGVSAGPAPQHGLREECFTPHRDQAARVEISRMQ